MEKKHDCRHCGKTFFNPWALKKHIDDDHIMDIDNHFNQGI